MMAAALCAALLVLPCLVWLLAPRPTIVVPPAPSAQPIAATPNVEPSSRPRDTRPARSTASAAPSDVPVVGVVLDPDGKPVKGAYVGCADRESSTTTNAEGRFTLPPDAAGCLAVAHHPDFVPTEKAPLVAGRDNRLELRKAGGIEGTVVDEHGAPVPSYLLAVETFAGTGEAADTIPPTGETRTVNDPAGTFLWEGLQPGHYVLTVSAEGRPPTHSDGIDVEPSRVRRGVRVVLPHGASLSGKVVDADTRKPVAGAMIALDAMTSTSANAIKGTRSDETGAYTIDGVPPGPFSLRVTHEQHRTKIVTGITTRGLPAITQDIELAPRGDGGADDAELAGIGALLAPRPPGVAIGMIVPGSPASKAGLRMGDQIVRIDGFDARTLPMSDCVQRLRGPDGSRVLVAVQRDGKVIDVTVTRAIIVR